MKNKNLLVIVTKIILVVEDDVLQRDALTQGLTQVGFDVYSAVDGADGLKQAQLQHPDVILTDLAMPKMGGMEMIHKLREDSWGKNVPIIILTNYENTDNQLDKILVDYPSYYLMKVDNSLDKIIEKINELLK